MKSISRFAAAAIITVAAFALPASATALEVPTTSISSKSIIMPTGYSWDISQWFCRTYGAMCPR
ncbi:hypothetical protein [Neomicrococcus aestuarii]|uniref:Uncharacterized protein n=1 Tax=Neomicrococcus aestuarii TaxID=556325 RepID=A0A1L2ZNI0_9MICC|nr:hypothetical protein [Neomicrococcus aestuarii]APF40777.1 hypothetical protein BHE16_06875 [Neomicrococcus aestuarii]MBB5512551.1 hypothetical protein [Neomicrococcus aestuarii]